MPDVPHLSPPSHRQRFSDRWRAMGPSGKALALSPFAVLALLVLLTFVWRFAGRPTYITQNASPETREIVRYTPVLTRMARPLTDGARQMIGYTAVGTGADGEPLYDLDPDREALVLGQLFDPAATSGAVFDLCRVTIGARGNSLVVTHGPADGSIELFDCSAPQPEGAATSAADELPTVPQPEAVD